VIGPIAVPPTSRGRPLFNEPRILTAPTQNLGADIDLRREVEDHGIIAADCHTVSWPGTEFQESVFDADPVHPISQVTNRFGVAEIGLLDPALRFFTAYPPQVTFPLHLEFRRAYRSRLEYDPRCR
jgi:hypothetical protein